MDIRTKEYFETELENILFIHFNAKYYFEDVRILNNPDTISQKIIAHDHYVIKRIRIAFWRLGIIEIAKLFQKSRNQHYNLITYIEELREKYKDYTWIKELPKRKLFNWLRKLNSVHIKTIRTKVSIQRDKYFAHTDKNPDIKLDNVQISFDEIQELLNLTESIIFDLKVHCLSTHSDFEVAGMEKTSILLDGLIALKEKKEAEFKKEWDEFQKE